jgi:DNA helicase HerA-like ATPase
MYFVYGQIKSDDLYRAYILGFTGVFTSFLVAGLTEWNFGDHEIITLIWFHLGLMFAMYKAFKQSDVKA